MSLDLSAVIACGSVEDREPVLHLFAVIDHRGLNGGIRLIRDADHVDVVSLLQLL